MRAQCMREWVLVPSENVFCMYVYFQCILYVNFHCIFSRQGMMIH